jgi:hypothetical protein
VFIFMPNAIGDRQGHGHCASVGFCGTTYEVMLAPSLEIEGLSGFFVCKWASASARRRFRHRA